MNISKRSTKLWTTSLLLLVCLLAACGKQSGSSAHERLSFADDVRLRTTPVKDQGASSWCWIYAMLATIETEHLEQGDSINLSVDYVARAFLREQALTTGRLTQRGMATMTLRLLQTYGLTHYDAYHHGDNDRMGTLVEQLQMAHNRTTSLTDRSRLIDQQLDRFYGEAMPRVFFLGAEYTPLEFAHSVCRNDEYEALTSFTHHPYGQAFPLEVPDNYYHDAFLNVPMDTLFNKVARSLLHGHPACWEGDTSEPGFSFARGVAVLPASAVVSPETRQAQLECGETTDDHCMTIVGLAHDQHGRRYFLLKNSWGTGNRYGGYMYMSEAYFKMKTVAVVMLSE